uniref:Uncharacterized protein n=2 Tax=Phaeomonas parva TaxID=124430 RepID=A0A7S1UKJ7_9STRA|mmetsp:Transcript_9171/g.26799  ORF Transcript_9171/g.26799 Transcript_9171/m.26799 type:complete len:164 (+) Transcript_9171:63-554(+)
MIYEEPPSVMIGGGSSVRSASVIDEEEASQALNPVIRPHTQSKFARRLGQPDKDGYIRALPAATSPKRKRRGGARTQAGARGKGLRVSTSMGAMQHASVTFSPVALRHKLGSDARTSKGLTAGSLLQALEEASVGSLDMRPHREWDTSSLGSAESFEQITRIA